MIRANRGELEGKNEVFNCTLLNKLKAEIRFWLGAIDVILFISFW